MLRSCLSIVILLMYVPVWGSTYYVDAIGGNDKNTGTTTNNAWRTISKVNASSFFPGDSILLKRGQEWEEQLTVSSSGNNESPITFGAYGIGSKPIIIGSSILNSWKKVGNTGVYVSSRIGSNCWDIYQNHISLNRASSKDCLDGNWFSVKNETAIWYRPTVGMPIDHVIRQPYRNYGVFMENQHHIVISNLDIQEVRIGVGLNDCHNVIIDSCEIRRTWAIGISLEATGSMNPKSHVTITNNFIAYSNNGIYLYAYHSKYKEFDGYNNVQILNNTIVYTNWEGHYSKYLGTDGNAIGAQNIHDCIVANNKINYAWEGISIWTSKNKTTENNAIMNNYIDYAGKWGLWWGADSLNSIKNNKIIYNIISNCGLNGPGRYPLWGGIRLTDSHRGKNYIYNNTLYSNDSNIVLYKGDYYEIKNNLSLFPKAYHIYMVDTVGSHNVILYNNYYDDKGFKFYCNDKAYNFAGWVKECRYDAQPYSFSTEPVLASSSPVMPSDFMLTPRSPLIDSAEYLGLIQDYIGNIVPHGVAPDIGALEYQGN